MKKQLITVFVILAVLCASYFVFLGFLDKNQKISDDLSKNSIVSLNTVIVANTEPLRELGLGNRDSLPQDTGMLFTFDQPGFYNFWMKDMKFPIDIIWLNENLQVIRVEKDISPETYPKTFGPSSKSIFVLEVNAKIAEKNNYKEGSTLTFLKGYLHMK